MSDRPDTPLLDTVNFPADIRALSKDQLPELAPFLPEMDDLDLEEVSSGGSSGRADGPHGD